MENLCAVRELDSQGEYLDSLETLLHFGTPGNNSSGPVNQLLPFYLSRHGQYLSLKISQEMARHDRAVDPGMISFLEPPQKASGARNHLDTEGTLDSVDLTI